MSQRAMTAAKHLVKQFSEQVSCWPLLQAITKHFSIRVDKHPFRGKNFDGMLWHDHNAQQWVILVNSNAHAYRVRFTVAHEIAHFILHRDLMDAFCCTPDAVSSDPLEWEANAFASELLMPLEKLLPYITEYPIPDVQTASRHLGVSQAAINNRITRLRNARQIPDILLWRLNPKYQSDEFYIPFSNIQRLSQGEITNTLRQILG